MWEKALVALTVLLGKALEPSRLEAHPCHCDCSCYCESGPLLENTGDKGAGLSFWTVIWISLLVSHALVFLVTRHCVSSLASTPVTARSIAGSTSRRRGRGVIGDASW